MSEKAIILAVDDTSESLALLVDLLTPVGYEVRAADSGELALAAAAASPPDLILLDLRMRDMDGLEVCRRLKAREDTRHIPIILISAFAEAKEWVEGLKLGAVDYITKPFQPEELLIRVQTHLALVGARASLAQQAVTLHQAHERLQAEIIERRNKETELCQELVRAERSRLAMLSTLEDQIRTDRELRDSKQLVDAVIENIPLMVFLKEAEDLRFVIFNKAGEDLLGYDRKDLLGKNNLDLFPPTQAAHFMAKDREVLARGLALDIPEEPIDTANHGQRLLHTRKVCIKGEDGVTKYLLGISEDITKHKEAETELRRSQERFELIAKTIDEVFWMADVDIGNSFYVSPAYERVWGRSLQSLSESPRSFLAAIHPDDIERVIRDLEVKKIGQSFEHEYRIIRPDGSIRWILDRGIPVKEENGQITRYVGVARDITKLKQTEDEIKSLNVNLEQKVRERTAQLRATNQELEAFAYSISHDLKAPLRSIAGFSQAMIEDYSHLLPLEGQDYLQRVKDEALRMGILIDDLLRLSRLSEQALAIEEVDLTALALSILKDLATREPQRRVRCELDPVLKVHGDPVLLRVLLDNLLGNAWKFTSKVEGACIQVRQCPCAPGWFSFSVSDNGAGFDLAYSTRLYTPFRRLHSPEDFPGTGIGLAIVRRIANRHGAEIHAEGYPGKGATFTLSFPAFEA